MSYEIAFELRFQYFSPQRSSASLGWVWSFAITLWFAMGWLIKVQEQECHDEQVILNEVDLNKL